MQPRLSDTWNIGVLFLGFLDFSLERGHLSEKITEAGGCSLLKAACRGRETVEAAELISL